MELLITFALISYCLFVFSNKRTKLSAPPVPVPKRSPVTGTPIVCTLGDVTVR